MPGEFLTLGLELQEVAIATEAHFARAGYRASREPQEIGFPDTPTLVVKRQGAKIIVLVLGKLRLERIDVWCGYAKSQTTDVRVCIVVPQPAATDAGAVAAVRALSCGLMTCNANAIAELFPATDLTVPGVLPPVANYHSSLRALFSAICEKFARGEWQDALFDAQVALEDTARSRLAKAISTTPPRIVVLDDKGNPLKLTKAIVNKATMGQLAKWYANIVAPNLGDETLGKLLKTVNPHRIGNAHKKLNSAVKRRLKRIAVPQIWQIFHALDVAKR